ncbi:MAG: HIT-like domain-containing protein [Piptocephalis tieghemiana]|nr:MAG: HIT-like domain-containing protein [Piptocephalis tieghemiana]
MPFCVPSTKVPSDSPEAPCPFCHPEYPDQAARVAKLPEAELNPADLVAFHDLHPAGKPHILVCPRAHVRNIQALRPGNLEDQLLLASMIQYGKALLAQHLSDGQEGNIRLGFHRPPFASVPHLHLHCIAQVPTKGWRRFKYPGKVKTTPWWMEAHELQRRLGYPSVPSEGDQAKSP